MAAVEQLTDPCTFHGEGPYWDWRGGRLLFVDMLAGAVVALSPDGGLTRSVVGDVAAVVRARRDGGFVVGVERGFALTDDSLAVTETLPPVFSDDAVRMNEGGCDPQGRFYCGSMAYEGTPGAGSLYRLDPDRSVRTVLSGVTVSNGIQWSADGGTVYYNDTETGRVDAFDFDGDTGAFSHRRPFAVIDPDDGAPDGMAIDAEGGVWVALFGGSAVRRYDAGGVLTEELRLPASHVTACAFGGQDGRTLFITTSQEGIDTGEEPTAGAVFRAEVGVAGGTVHDFAG
ncbi:SMP-30/gluconolactonase/LRE family protein [Planctomonas deserti]|uniref:SMP-30/gluconolactonase/LRE family protein n=1 Tax=Planctomonas deserti TaxID=2144185 RepID=UPI000D3BA896|nr:SMP-30/gluconolactonase/LRE family protein [Planctomonas deserti]